jgi:prolycopene isomerase
MAALYFAYSEFLPYHLRGGSQAMSNALAQTVLEAGGDIRFNCGVRRILVDDDGVAGVVTDAGDTITARHVVSNVSKVATYVDLIEAHRVPPAVFDELRQARIGPSAFTVYLGLDAEAADLGMTASTTFIVGDTDPDRVYARMFQREIGPRDGMLLTCYNAIDPGFSPPGTCQAALVTLKYGESWGDVPPRDYADEKYRIAADMLGAAERVFPGLRGRVEEMEIATPLTHQRYLGHPRGAIYGFDHHIKDSSLFVANRAHIRGLYGAGGWYGSGGFQPTLESGVAAARAVLRHLNRSEAR